MIVPCKNCELRKQACHTICEKYKEWKSKHLVRKEKIIAELEKQSLFNRYQMDSIKKTKKKYKK